MNKKDDNTFGKELIKIELQQAIETYRSSYTLFLQIVTVCILANVSLLTYALSSQKVGLILICAIFPIMVFITLFNFKRWLIPLIYTAIFIEVTYGIKNTDYLLSTFFSIILAKEEKDGLIEIAKSKTHDQRMTKLKNIKMEIPGTGKYAILGCFIFIIGQIIFAFMLLVTLHWHWF